MGWFSDLVDSITGGDSSSSSGGGYEEAAYGGQRGRDWTFGGTYDQSGGYNPPSAPAPAKPVDPYAGMSDAYRQYAEAMKAAGITNLAGDEGAIDLLSSLGGDVTSSAVVDPFLQQYDTFRTSQGDTFQRENLTQLGDYASGDFAGGEFTGMLAYDIPDDFGARATNFLAPRVLGSVAGNVAGTVAYDALGNPMAAGQLATGADAVTRGILSKSKIADTVQLADGTIGYITNFAGKQGFTTRDAVTARNVEAAQQPQEEDDAGRAITQGLAMAAEFGGEGAGSASRGRSWRDYYSGGFKFDPVDFATQMFSSGLTQMDQKSLQFAGRVAGGENIVSAASTVFGDAVREVLPEGYEKPTEAAIRIGLGENRVAVFGDVYGDDFNLDTPMGKAGLKGAEVYDMTGDGDKALSDAVYTYFKEGGKLPSMEGKLPTLAGFEVPDWLPDGINLNVGNFDWWKNAGFTFKDIADIPDINLPDIDFGGMKLGEIEGLSLDNLGDFGLDIGDLPSMNIDFSFELKQRKRKQLESLEDDEDFVSLGEDEDLLDPTRSLARELLGMEQTKSVQQAQENA